MKRCLKLTIMYDGTAYHGFQRQKNGLTIQEVLEERLSALFGHKLAITGSGRTDQGVHATGQVVNFYTTGTIPTDRVVFAAKSVLPSDIAVVEAQEVAEDFHATRSATSKCYCYKLYLSPIANPFYRHYAWHIEKPLDVEAMKEASLHLSGTHDFSSFCAAGGSAKSSVRTLYSIEVAEKDQIAEWRYWGNGFLYHMVRNLMGTLVEVGLGKRQPDSMLDLIKAQDRRAAGTTAPPQGLYLEQVYYENDSVSLDFDS